nr:sigma factor-like helix-turn-helix DNA-binding protein [uncultured Acetatifactor sp.]
MAIPKRSYWLREVVTENGTSYHISFRDGQGKIQELCVPYDFYMAFRRLELDERKLEGWDYRHREFSEIMEETLNWRALRLPKSIEEVILEEERAELLHKAINTLPEIQKRRFLLYYEYDLNYYQIGAMEHCTPQAVRRSVIIAREKIKAQMKNYLCA